MGRMQMGKSKGPHVRHRTRENQTIKSYRDHFGKEGLDYLEQHPIQAQVVKEFTWLFSKSVSDDSGKYIKKMGNWCNAHPDRAVEYLFDTAMNIAVKMGITGVKRVEVLMFFISKFDVGFLMSRYSMQSRLSKLREDDTELVV